MTLYTTGRDALDYWCEVCVGGQCDDCTAIRHQAVRVLDYEDRELIRRVARLAGEDSRLVRNVLWALGEL
jgi:heterodisulfide reductase subunit C